MERGPKHVIIKKGEHGAFMFTESTIFFAPAYPLESVFDPTGAGDSFAGGFMGYLARTAATCPRRTCGAPSSTVRRWDRSPSRNSRSSGCSRSRRPTSSAASREFHRLVNFEQESGVSESLDYRTAGVDIDAADDAKHRIKAHVVSTLTAGARGEFGGFGGMFRVPTDVPKPVLVSSADGVGTKLKVAIEAEPTRHRRPRSRESLRQRHSRAGRDAAVLSRLRRVRRARAAVVEAVVAGVAAGCRENGCALLGGETAEMPGVYTPPDYDLAGFIVGYVDEDAILGAQRVQNGDVLIGVESSGLHTNGFSLARRIVSRANEASNRRCISRRRPIGWRCAARGPSVVSVVVETAVVQRSMRWRTSPGAAFPET